MQQLLLFSTHGAKASALAQSVIRALPLRAVGFRMLPYALAAHLLAGEDSDLSLWFQRQYALQLAELQAQTPGRWEAISMPYGAF